MIKADLHMHSTYSSDGQYSVSRLIEFVKAADLNLFSITDHNDIQASLEICQKSLKSNKFIENRLNFVTGIEFSTYFNGTEIHLLAYGANPKSDKIAELIEEYKINRLKQTELRVENLKKLGFKIDFDEVMRVAEGKTASGVTFLKVLKSYKENINKLYDYLEGDKSDSPYTNFYFDYFFKGGLAYVDISLLDYEKVVNKMKDEVVLVVAHPGLYPENLIDDLIIEGIEGIEVFSTYHNDEKMNYFNEICKKHNLIKTVGSDFHGEKIKPGINVGEVKSFDDTDFVRFTDLLTSKNCQFYLID